MAFLDMGNDSHVLGFSSLYNDYMGIYAFMLEEAI